MAAADPTQATVTTSVTGGSLSVAVAVKENMTSVALRPWRRVRVVAALALIVAGSLGAGARSLALADSGPATPVAVVETPSPSATIMPTDAPAPAPSDAVEASAAHEISLATPVTTAAALVHAIRVSALTDEHAAKPGAATDYRFRIENDSLDPTAVKLAAMNSAAHWTAQILDSSGRIELDHAITIPARGFIEVIVRVTAPPAARFGDQNSTTLVASLISALP